MVHELNLWLTCGGLGLGLLFGIAVQRSRFCTLAAASNWVLMRDLRQVHGYLAAVAVAVAGTALLEFTELVPVAASTFRDARVDWLGALAGGTVFGIGMVLAGGCAGRLLVRGAEGSGGALLALGAVALGAATSVYGVLAPLRFALVDATAVTLATGDSSLTALIGLPSWVVPVALVSGCVLAIAPAIRRNESPGLIIAGAVIGALVVSGWFLTGYLAQDEFDMTPLRPMSLSFATPLAQVLASAENGLVMGNGFGLALVAGVLGGAFVSASMSGTLRWTLPASREIVRIALGGGLMGIGAVFAGGCNIGQGLTGLSTCSIFALLAIVGTVLGLRLGLVWLMHVNAIQPDRRSYGRRPSRIMDEAG